jgi:hypothetical protein
MSEFLRPLVLFGAGLAVIAIPALLLPEPWGTRWGIATFGAAVLFAFGGYLWETATSIRLGRRRWRRR